MHSVGELVVARMKNASSVCSELWMEGRDKQWVDKVMLAEFRDTVHSCSRHGVVAAKLVSRRPGGVIQFQKTFISSRLHSWLQSLRPYLGEFKKLRKATISFVMPASLYVCPSVHPLATTRLSLDGFSWTFIFEYFLKIRWENSTFTKIWQE